MKKLLTSPQRCTWREACASGAEWCTRRDLMRLVHCFPTCYLAIQAMFAQFYIVSGRNDKHIKTELLTNVIKINASQTNNIMRCKGCASRNIVVAKLCARRNGVWRTTFAALHAKRFARRVGHLCPMQDLRDRHTTVRLAHCLLACLTQLGEGLVNLIMFL